MNTECKILITGGSGMVGSQVNFGIKPTHYELDITDISSVENYIEKNKPSVVFHFAALADMSLCEQNPDDAYRVNVLGTENIAKACKKHGIKLVYLSTCVVFDGKKETPYNENDKVGPISMYGKTKIEGENVIQSILTDALIIRTGWLFGGGKNDKKFIRAFYLKISANEEINAVSDRYGSPTYVPDLIDAILELLKENKNGIYHVVNSGSVTYKEVAEKIKFLTGSTSNINPINSANVDNPFIIRSKMESLYSSKITLRPWNESVTAYIDILRQDSF